jgi:hypothetical protein
MNFQVTEEAFSSQSEHPTLQHMKFFNFFLLLWVIFAILDSDPDSDPDPLTRLNPDPIGIRIRNPGGSATCESAFILCGTIFITCGAAIQLMWITFFIC